MINFNKMYLSIFNQNNHSFRIIESFSIQLGIFIVK